MYYITKAEHKYFLFEKDNNLIYQCVAFDKGAFVSLNELLLLCNSITVLDVVKYDNIIGKVIFKSESLKLLNNIKGEMPEEFI